MALQTLFANLTQATGQELDDNFAAVGAIGVIPCVAVGTNALVLTPGANTPTIAAYADYERFSFIAQNPNSAAVNARIGTLPILNVYKNTTLGPAVLVSGDIIAGNAYVLIYDSALNASAGGFHIDYASTSAAATVSSVALTVPSSLFVVAGSPITTAGTLAITFTTIAANSLLANATGGVAVPSIFSVSALMDSALGNAQGDVAYRNSSLWTVLAPGSKGQHLVTGGAGVNPQFGETQTLAIAAAGTITSTATVLTSNYNEVTTVASGSGVRLPAVTQMLVVIYNRGANPLNVYPPIGGQVDALGTNTATTIATLGVGAFYGTTASQVYTTFTH